MAVGWRSTRLSLDASRTPRFVRGRITKSRCLLLSIVRLDVRAQWSWTTSSRAISPRSCSHNVAREARLLTDEAHHYRAFSLAFTGGHDAVRHGAGEYVRGDVHTNTIEGYFSIFKRGMRGIYQHCAKKHLNRYLAEFDFRYTHPAATGYNDTDRADKCCAVSWGAASPIKQLITEPRRYAEEERAARKSGGSKRSVQSRGAKADRRWRVKPHRGRSSSGRNSQER